MIAAAQLSAAQLSAPPTGIYENVPFETYLSWPYISNSLMSHAQKSLKHVERALRGGFPEETDAMRFGTLVHQGKLEPLAMAKRYVIRPRFEDQIRKPNGAEYDSPRSTKAYREAVAEWKATLADQEEVTAAEYEKMVGVVTALSEHTRARQYLDGPGPVEVSLVWDDPETGARCKGRADKLKLDQELFADLKTAFNPWDFEDTIARRGYHRQGAFYADGIQVLTGVRCRFGLVAAESADPFGVRAAPLADDALRAGRNDYRKLLARIVGAKVSGQWDESTDPDAWCLPAWAAADSEPVALTFGGQSVTL